MTPQEIFKRIEEKFGADKVFDLHADPAKDKDVWFQVAPWEIETVCEYLRTEPGLEFDYLECITGVDYPTDKKIAVVYHLYSYTRKHRIVLKAMLDRDDLRFRAIPRPLSP
jgi:NADH-quinone oxidoreductase subunit C